jgi:two-component system, chemotaxis family, CheB/CheR fusion protein
MPRNAVAAGCVDFVLSPEAIAAELTRIARHPYVKGVPPRALAPAVPAPGKWPGSAADAELALPLDEPGRGWPSAEEPAFRKILLLLRNHAGVDFSLYKPTTIERRVTRRMVLNKADTVDAYANSLRGNAKELQALSSDLLIRAWPQGAAGL